MEANNQKERIHVNIEVLSILLAILVGMTLFASQHLPEFTDVIISIIISSTVIFKLIGPVVARKALILAGERQRDR